MKGSCFLLYCLCCLQFFTAAVFAQDTRHRLHDNSAPAQIKKVIAPASTLPDYYSQLSKITSPVKRVDLYYAIGSLHLNSLKIDSGIYYAQQIRLLSESANYATGLGKYNLLMGSALFYRNRSAEVTSFLNKAIDIFASEQDNLYLGLTYHQMARQLAMETEYKAAQQYYRIAIPLIQKAGDLNRLQWAVHNCGRNFFFTLETDSAAYYLSRAVKLAEELQSNPKIFNSASMLGTVYLFSGDIADAEHMLNYALSVQPLTADKIQLRGLWANYAEVLVLQGKYANAKKAIAEFEKLNSLFGDLSGNLTGAKLHGMLSYYEGSYATAYQQLAEAHRLKTDEDLFFYDLMGVNSALGRTELKLNFIDSAIRHFKELSEYASQTNYIAGILEGKMLLAEAFQQKGQVDSAYAYFRSYAHLKDSILTFKKEQTILELSARYDAEKREQQIHNLETSQEILNYQIALKNTAITQQELLNQKKSQQLTVLEQQAEIDRLQASEKNLALQASERDFAKKQQELELAQKEQALQSALTRKQAQVKNLLFIVLGLMIAIGAYGTVRYRKNRLLNRRLAESLTELKAAQIKLIQVEKEKEAASVRHSISQDIHDEVGATLSGVALFSEIAKEKIEAKKDMEAGEYLQYISDNSKEMVEKMSDIIWTINPRNDSFERILTKLQSYAMNLCSSKEIALKVEFDEELRTLMPSMQDRKNIYLLLKEALNNAVKYSSAQNIYFSIRQNGKLVVAQVKDDGNGFNLGAGSAGNGITNMQERAKNLGTVLKIETSPGCGTTVLTEFNPYPNEVEAK